MGFTGLIGKYEHTIDSNGRLSIPTRFREYITHHSEGSIVMTKVNMDSCVVVYPLPAWQTITSRFSQMEQVPGESTKDFVRRKDILKFIYSRAVDCCVDKQGRILLPAHLREEAGLERDVILVGNMTFFEIWNVQQWQAKEADVFSDPERVQEAMAHLGL